MKIATDVSLFIVEDDELFRETFMDAMAVRGAKVEGAGTGAEALRRLRTAQPAVIILDVQLPDIHGFELCRCIKKSDRLKDVPVIFLSASSKYSDPRDRVEGLLAGAAAFVPKPVTLDKLWSEISALVSSR